MSVRRIKAGTADVSVVLRIIDATDGTPETGVVFNTSGIDLWYRRELAASVDITEATLAALTTAHSDGGFLHINDGWYRLDLPDAACAAGVAGVQIGGTVTGMVVLAPYIELPVNTEEDVYTRIGAPAGASIAADIATVDNFVDTEIGDIQARLPAALVSGRIDASVGAMAANTVTASAIADNAIDAGAIAADAITAAKIANGAIDAATFAAGAVDEAALGFTAFKRAVIGNVLGTVGAASTTTSVVTSSLSPAAAVANQFKGRILTFDRDTTTANLRGQASDITASTDAGVLTVSTLTTAPVSGDTFTIT